MLKKFLSVLLIAVITMTGQIAPASADAQVFGEYSPQDPTYPSGFSASYRLFVMSVQVMQSDPSTIIIKTGFNSALNNTSFLNTGIGQPKLRIIFSDFPFARRDDWGFLTIETPSYTPYQSNSPIDAVASKYTNPSQKQAGGRSQISDCKVKTWMEPGAQTSVVAFSIDRVCAEIPNIFYINALIDTNETNLNTYPDYKFVPLQLMYMDMSYLPRPKKMKNQTVSFGGSIGTQNLDDPQVSTYVSSSLGMPVLVTSLTPSICIPSMSNNNVQVKLLAAGTCSLDAFAEGNDSTNPSPHVGMSFTVNPKVMINQEFYWTEPDMVQVGDDPIDLGIYSSSHLDVTVKSLSPGVCQFRDPSNPSVVTPVGEGDCVISVSQAGNDKYYPRLDDQATFWIDAAPVVTPTSKPSPRPSHTRSPSGGGGSTGTRVLSGTATASAAPTVKVTQKAGVGNLAADGSAKVDIKCKKGLITTTVHGSKKNPPKCKPGYKQVK